MVFPSFPFPLDPPNWNLQQGSSGGGGEVPRREDGMASSMRPTSMVERARLAKVPPPETALKCPRCDSTNTKFCYFNNYSLLQPRHFCKTCRRYWTQGGGLRNVPVGGGYRRNKRRSKSGSGGSAAKSSTTQSTTMTSVSSGAIPSNTPPAPPLLPLRALMHHIPDYGASNKGLGLGFTGIQSMDTVDQYQFGSSSGIGLDQWRLQQLPLFGGLESSVQTAPPAPGLFPFDEGQYYSGQLHAKASTSGHITQLASVKMEDLNRTQGLDLQQEYNSGWPADLSDFNLPPS